MGQLIRGIEGGDSGDDRSGERIVRIEGNSHHPNSSQPAYPDFLVVDDDQTVAPIRFGQIGE